MPDRQRTVLIFRIGSMGDTLVALPSFRHIRAAEPKARIVLLTNVPIDGGVKAASSFQILEHLHLVDEYIEYRVSSHLSSFFALALALRQLHVARCYYLMPVRTAMQRIRDRVFFLLAGVYRVTGLSLQGRLEQRRAGGPDGGLESEAARLLRMVGAEPSNLSKADFSLQITPSESQRSNEMMHGLKLEGGFMVISIGTKAPAKDWGVERWNELVRRIEVELPQLALVFIGSADESARCEAMGAARCGPWFNLCGKLSPRESATLLSQATLFVGHDSGPMHLANAVDTPIVAIFSARNPRGIWFPFGQEKFVIYHEVSCAGCQLEACVEQQMRCIRSITVDEVVARINQRLALSTETTDGDRARLPG